MLTYKEVIQIELKFARHQLSYIEWQKLTGVYGQGMIKRLYRRWGATISIGHTIPFDDIDDWETFLLLLLEIYNG